MDANNNGNTQEEKVFQQELDPSNSKNANSSINSLKQ
jgi:hypothetical protein